MLIITIAFTALTPASAVPDGTENQTPRSSSLKETDRHSYCALLHYELITSFTTTIHDEDGERKVVVYPVEYAGAYIDHSNNMHVVLSKYATNTTINTYRNIMGNDPDIIFETAEFPLS